MDNINNNKEIVYYSVYDLIPYVNNPRNNEEAVDKVAASIQAFGFLVPIVIDKDKIVVAGHTRLLAAKRLGLKEVPTIMADDLDEDAIRAYRIIDNRVAEMAVWDLPLMQEMLDEVGDDIDMIQFGFDDVYVDPDDEVSMKEFDPDDFSDDAFEYECPKCGFRFDA